MQCDFVQIGERKYTCTRCGRTVGVPVASKHVIASCLAKLSPCDRHRRPIPPTATQRLKAYAGAMRKWIAAGRPTRSDDRVREIFETLCRPCEHFDAQRQTCRVCGCRVRASGSALANKIKMATERCPLRPPRWIEELSTEEGSP